VPPLCAVTTALLTSRASICTLRPAVMLALPPASVTCLVTVLVPSARLPP
jgi:hypothetical protein